MTFEQAKLRNDYSFSTYEIEGVLSEIRNNHMDSLWENGDQIRGAAVLEIGYVDIEVNICTKEQCGLCVPDEERKEPVIDYFTCLKRGDTEDSWDSDDYLERPVRVDWNAADWKEQLEEDMFLALDMYVKQNKYNYDAPNYYRGKQRPLSEKQSADMNSGENQTAEELAPVEAPGKFYKTAKQVCEGCGKSFHIMYCSDGTYKYLGETCSCEAGFHPADGEPSISEWLESLSNTAKCMFHVRQKEWGEIPNIFKGTWQDYYNEHPEWIGRRTVMSTCLNHNAEDKGKLFIEGIDFLIEE